MSRDLVQASRKRRQRSTSLRGLGALPTLKAGIADQIRPDAFELDATRAVRDAARAFDPSTAGQLQISKLQQDANTSKAIREFAAELVEIAIERTSAAGWSDFKHKSSNDCSYFGIYQYADMTCDLETQATLLFAFDVYADAFAATRNLLRQDPDTFGLAEVGVDYVSFKDVLDEPCTVLRDPRRPRLSEGITWRGYARLQWVKAMTQLVSAAMWATNMRTGFLYGIGMGERAASRAGLPVGEPWTNVHEDELWAWGPDSVKEWIAGLWQTATNAGAEFFLPIPTQSFVSASQDPGLDQPWIWGSTGKLIDTQTRAELKRGKRRRSERRAERRGRDGFYGTQPQFDAFGGGRVQMPTNTARAGTFASFARPSWSLPPDFELALALSTQGEALVSIRDVVEKGERAWLMPSGDMLVRYARLWGEEVVNLDIADHMLRGNIIYLDYLKRFAEFVPLTEFSPEQIAYYEALGNMVETRGNKRGVMFVPAANMTLRELEQMGIEIAKKKAAKTAGIVNAAIPVGVAVALAVAGAVATVPIAGWIASAIIIVLTALVTFFTWLFGGSLVGCPKAPRPMCLRSLDDVGCNFDIAQSEQTVGESWDAIVTTGAALGVRFTFPKGNLIEPPPNTTGADYQFPGLPPSPEPEPSRAWLWGLVAVAVGGGALYAATR